MSQSDIKAVPSKEDDNPEGKDPDFKDRIAVVTGASRGLGAALAKALGAKGAKCILIARTVGGLEEIDDVIRSAGGDAPLLVPHNLEQTDGLDQLGASLYERFGHVDIIAGCAAELGPLTPIGHCPPDVWQRIQSTNATANYRLIRSLDPLFKRSSAGRGIFVTDVIATERPAYWGPYASSKSALEAIVQSYAAELNKTPHRVNLVCPPPMRTVLRASAFPGEDPNNLPLPDLFVADCLTLLSRAETRNGMTVKLSPSS